MGFVVVDRMGGDCVSPSRARMAEILAELDHRDPEHPDVWLTHDSGWTLTVHEQGVLIWENLEQGTPRRHQHGRTRDDILKLWQRLAAGFVDEIEREPWLEGDGIAPPTAAERGEHDAWRRDYDRAFYDQLGPERPGTTCAASGCARGAVRASLFCRTHQFENVRRRPCPFS